MTVRLQRNARKCALLVIATILLINYSFAQPGVPWRTNNFGKFKIGFSTRREQTTGGDKILISFWYPAGGGGKRMTLRDYITADRVDASEPDSAGVRDFKRVLELPFLFHLSPIKADDYNATLSTLTNSYRDAAILTDKYPLVIAICPPQNYISSFETLASNGYWVASVTYRGEDENIDSLLYVKPTRILGELLDYMWKQPYIDTSRVSAIGHGWGIQAAFFLAMKTNRLKSLINMDGGVFGPRSKTDLSIDYHPTRLTIPMLHITTGSTRRDDDLQQFNVLNNPRYSLDILSDSVSHHDFSTYGRVVGNILHARDSIGIINRTYDEVHKAILLFLKNRKIDSSLNPALVDVHIFSPQ